MTKTELQTEIERLTESAKRAVQLADRCDSGRARQSELDRANELTKQAQQLQQQLNEME